MFVRNAWYVAAWDTSSGETCCAGSSSASRSCFTGVERLAREEQGRARGR